MLQKKDGTKMITPPGWTNYSGGTYSVRVPTAPMSRSAENEGGHGRITDNENTSDHHAGNSSVEGPD